MGFKLGQPATYCGFRDVERLGSADETAGIDDFYKESQGIEV